MAVGKDVHKESDGKAVEVTLSASVDFQQLAYVNGWIGITANSGGSGGSVNLDISNVERQLELPTGGSSISAAVGDDIYVDTTAVTGHTFNSGAYSKTSGANKVKIAKVTGAEDANGITLVKMQTETQ